MEIEGKALEESVIYVLQKEPKFSEMVVSAIIFTANIHHILLFGRAITKGMMAHKGSFEFVCSEVDDIFKRKSKPMDMEKFDYLSDSDKDSLDFAIIRYLADLAKVPTMIRMRVIE